MSEELQRTAGETPDDKNPQALSITGLDVRDFYAVADAVKALSEEFIARVCKDEASIKAFNYAREIQPIIDKWSPQERTPERIQRLEEAMADFHAQPNVGSRAENTTQRLTLGHTELLYMLNHMLTTLQKRESELHLPVRGNKDAAGQVTSNTLVPTEQLQQSERDKEYRLRGLRESKLNHTKSVAEALKNTHERVMACAPDLDPQLMQNYIQRIQRIVAAVEDQSKKLDPLRLEEERQGGWIGYTSQWWQAALKPLVGLPMTARFGSDGESEEWKTYRNNRYRSGKE